METGTILSQHIEVNSLPYKLWAVVVAVLLVLVALFAGLYVRTSSERVSATDSFVTTTPADWVLLSMRAPGIRYEMRRPENWIGQTNIDQGSASFAIDTHAQVNVKPMPEQTEFTVTTVANQNGSSVIDERDVVVRTYPARYAEFILGEGQAVENYTLSTQLKTSAGVYLITLTVMQSKDLSKDELDVYKGEYLRFLNSFQLR